MAGFCRDGHILYALLECFINVFVYSQAKIAIKSNIISNNQDSPLPLSMNLRNFKQTCNGNMSLIS